MANSSTSAERLIGTAFFLPIGLCARLIEDAPDGIAKARRHIVLARFVGKMAVDRGVKELQRHLGSESGAATPTTEPRAVEAGEPAEPAAASVSATAARERSVEHGPSKLIDTVSADDLALPDYDHLPAAHIIGKLDGLTTSEREAIESYEHANRHRRTVLGKLDQLRED